MVDRTMAFVASLPLCISREERGVLCHSRARIASHRIPRHTILFMCLCYEC